MISIPTKSQKSASVLVDALRIIAWTAYKSEQNNKPKSEESKDKTPYEIYQDFIPEWLEHEVHKMDLPKLQKFIKDLGYSENELQQIRSEYYEKKSAYKSSESSESKIRELRRQYDEPGF